LSSTVFAFSANSSVQGDRQAGATESLLRYIAAERGQLNPKSEVALLLEEKEKKPVNYSCLSNEDFAEYRRIALILHAEREGKRVVNSVIEDESKDGTGQAELGSGR
jgi:hypothetical protein